MFVIVCVRLRIRGSRCVVKIREKQKKNTETRLVMRAGPELGKKSAGVLRREGSLPGGRVCAIRLISDRVQFRLRTRSYGPRSSPDSIVHSVRFGSILGIECVRERKQNKNIETRLPSGWTAGPSSVRETGKMQTRVWRE